MSTPERDDLPPVTEYPGYFPAARRVRRWPAATAAGIGGLLLGLVVGVGSPAPSDTPEAREVPSTEATVTVTAEPDTAAEPDQDAVAAAEKAAEEKVQDLQSQHVRQLTSLRAKSAQKLRSVRAAARSTQKRAVAQAVAQAVRQTEARQRASAPTRSSVPSSGGGGGTDPRFSYCYEANDAGYGPYRRGQDVEYGWYRDNDGDGTVCE